jgi:cephalosporin hydroxylase
MKTKGFAGYLGKSLFWGRKSGEKERIINKFHQLYYNSGHQEGTWQKTYWFGIPILKCPLDLWIYQEIIFGHRPDVIVESGTMLGGSALYLASICDLVGCGLVITIDIQAHAGRPQHDRITYVTGSSTDDTVVKKVERMIDKQHKVMVILDSDHSEKHVARELEIYSQLVSPGCYLIVEDTNVNGHPVFPNHGPGPMEAVEKFLQARQDFTVDRDMEKFYLTFNPKGYLKKMV